MGITIPEFGNLPGHLTLGASYYLDIALKYNNVLPIEAT